MFVNAESELLEQEWQQKLDFCNRAVICPNPSRLSSVKVDLFLSVCLWENQTEALLPWHWIKEIVAMVK